MANIVTWVARLGRVCPIQTMSQELVRFDTQKLQHPEIAGVEYQHGELFGYEVREYLLEKWERTCVYCGKQNIPLEVEHIVPKSRGGTDRVSNLTLACRPCNERKGNRTAEECGHPHVHQRAQSSLNDAAAVNTVRWELYRRLLLRGVPLEVGTGGRTKHNRVQRGYPKAHWIDAACVGETGAQVMLPPTMRPLIITAMGRGSRQMCRVDRYGFPRTGSKCVKRIHGVQTGDMVKAVIPTGKYAGTHSSRVVVRASGWFDLTANGRTFSVHHRYVRVIQRTDGYNYEPCVHASPH